MDEFSRAETALDRVVQDAYDKGVYLFNRFNTLIIAPPLTITRNEIEQGVSVLDEALPISDQAMDQK